VTVVTLPTSMVSVQSAAVVSLVTTSYLARLDSGLAFQVRVVWLVPLRVPGGVVWIYRPFGVLGAVARAQTVAAFTAVTRAM
jgi:hypothetical protein